jgi:hypothetical protein
MRTTAPDRGSIGEQEKIGSFTCTPVKPEIERFRADINEAALSHVTCC